MILLILTILTFYIVFIIVCYQVYFNKILKTFNIINYHERQYISNKLSDKIYSAVFTFGLYKFTLNKKILDDAKIYSYNQCNPIKIFPASKEDYEKIYGKTEIIQNGQICVSSSGIILDNISLHGCVAIVWARSNSYSYYSGPDDSDHVVKTQYFGIPVRNI